MADRNTNRDRYRPYDEGFDEDYYDQDWRGRGNAQRNFDYGGGYGRGMQNRGYGGYDRDFDRGYGRNYGGGFNRGRYGGRNRDYDYDYDYGNDFNRMNRGYSGGWGFENYDRGYGGYGRNSDRYDRDYDRGNYSGGYNRFGGYGSSRSGYGRGQGGNYGGYGRNQGGFGDQNRYGGYSGYDQDMGYYDQGYYDQDYYGSDYDFDTEPSYWTYEEYWLIPGPYSGVGPENYQRSDDRIREDINDRLTQHGHLDARNIQVKVDNGEVTLTGNVDSRKAKRQAEDVADSVNGVEDVHNQLHVEKQGKQEGKRQGKMENEQQRGQRNKATQQGKAEREQQGQRQRET